MSRRSKSIKKKCDCCRELTENFGLITKMKHDLSSLDLYYLVKELKSLENNKIDRIYNSVDKKNELVIAIHVSGEEIGRAHV